MKKKSLFAFLLFAVLATVISCSGNNAEKLREDSIRKADSIAAVEADMEEALRVAEQARLDSIREDSLVKAQKEMEAFVNAIPTPALVIGTYDWATKIGSKLKGLGYTGSTQTKWDDNMDEEVTKGKYKIEFGDKSCSIEFEATSNLEFGEVSSKVTIIGDDEALDRLYQEVSQYVQKKGWKGHDGRYHISKQGNTVSASAPSSDM